MSLRILFELIIYIQTYTVVGTSAPRCYLLYKKVFFFFIVYCTVIDRHAYLSSCFSRSQSADIFVVTFSPLFLTLINLNPFLNTV